MLFRSRKRHNSDVVKEEICVHEKAPFSQFFFSLLIVFILAFWLANIANTIVENTKINESFVGSLFMAFVSSLPELTVSLAALRAKSLEMSIGNILGSNFFDSCIIPFMDIVYRPTAIMAQVKTITPIVSIGALLLTLIVVLSLLRERKIHKPRFILPSVFILIIGIMSYLLIYRAG